MTDKKQESLQDGSQLLPANADPVFMSNDPTAEYYAATVSAVRELSVSHSRDAGFSFSLPVNDVKNPELFWARIDEIFLLGKKSIQLFPSDQLPESSLVSLNPELVQFVNPEDNNEILLSFPVQIRNLNKENRQAGLGKGVIESLSQSGKYYLSDQPTKSRADLNEWSVVVRESGREFKLIEFWGGFGMRVNGVADRRDAENMVGTMQDWLGISQIVATELDSEIRAKISGNIK